MFRLFIPLTLVAVAFARRPVHAQAKEPAFERSVAKILIRRCLECHNATDKKGGLDLTQQKGLLAGGDSGKVVIAGKPKRSPLIERVRDGSMPPKKSDRLSKAEVQALTAWVKTGAKWPKGRQLSPFELSTKKRAGLDWWSLQPIRRPKLPQIKQKSWVRNPIDAFVLAQLESKGLKPSPTAKRRTLIRRLNLVITGLPPTPTEVKQFVEDQRPDAYRRAVARLLSSPHYGERWGRHWLDLARFAETNGFETNTPRPNAWRYRDYVIAAFNSDKPYDRFVKEQLAGDAFGAPVGTGFLVAGPYDTVKSPDINLTQMQRQDELHDIINATSTAFLGITVACARCHNHKFDPVLQKDYYAFQAIFAGVKHGDRRLPGRTSPANQQRIATVRRELKLLRAKLVTTGLREPINALRNEERFKPVRAKFIRFTIHATNQAEPCLDELEIWSAVKKPRNVALQTVGAKATSSGNYPNSAKHKLAHINDGRYGNSRSWISNQRGKGYVQIELKNPARINRIVWGRDRKGRYKDRLAIRYAIAVSMNGRDWISVASSEDRLPFGLNFGNSKPSRSKVPNEESLDEAKRIVARIRRLEAETTALSKPAAAYAGTFVKPGPTHRLHRGDPMLKREVVAPAAIQSLGRSLKLTSKSPERDRRAALANWIASDRNPLTARVMVNRIWQHHFGRGLVATPSDFGKMGVRPSHPQLLDWLAAEFIRNRYSVKHIQRLILTSNTWRQSSRPRAAAKNIDAGSIYLWRFPTRRLEAEAIRDSVLSVAGSLRTTMGGAGFNVFQPNTNYVRVYIPKTKWGATEWRRMIYGTKVRMEPDGVFGVLDCPDAGQATAKRARSTTPLQALNLLNSGFMLQQADVMAADVLETAGNNKRRAVEQIFLRAFGRKPTANETLGATKLVKRHGLRAVCRAVLNSNEFLFLQ